MRKIMVLAAFVLAVLLLVPLIQRSNSTFPDKENSTSSLNEKEESKQIESIIC